MREILEFIFGSFWRFAGVFLLLAVIGESLRGMFARRDRQ